MSSILTSTKEAIGIMEECTDFDSQIIMHINSVFMALNQIGVGPSNGFIITDSDAVWSDFVSDDNQIRLDAIQSYMALRVRMLFDPPNGSTIMESYNNQIKELEWRINVAAETIPGGSSGVAIDYNLLKNKPSINGNTLVGNYEEVDPTVGSISNSEIKNIWNSEVFADGE